MTEWKALCEELAEYLALLDEPPHELVCRAQEALAQPEPKAVGPTDEELFRIASDCAALYIADDRDYDNCSEVMAAMRAAIAADRARYGHQPAPPAEGEVAELVALLQYEAREADLDLMTAEECHRAADLLSIAYATGPEVWEPIAQLPQQRHPAPVPVSERLPGPGDCLDEGWAWFFSPRVGWRQAVLPVSAAYTHWLPAKALPLPQGEVQP